MRRPTLFLLGIILTLTIFSSSAWAVLQCGENLAGATTILKLSATTNAHGEIYSQSNYSTNINCRETSGVSVGPTQANPVILLKLSANTNAHAETAGGSNYNTLVQLGSASGQILVTIVDSSSGATTNECNDYDTANADYVDVVRINNFSNAHLQSPSYAGTKYRYIVCAAYDATGGTPPAENIATMDVQPNNSLAFPIPAQGSAAMDLRIQNQQYNDPDYTNIAALQFTFICDRDDTATGAMGLTCANLQSPSDVWGDALNYIGGNTNNVIIPSTVSVRLYKNVSDTTAWQTAYNTLNTNHPATDAMIVPVSDGWQEVLQQYVITPGIAGMNLPPGNYRILSVFPPAEYDRIGEGVGRLEDTSFYNDNVDYFDFTVNPGVCGDGAIDVGEECGEPTLSCTPPQVCSTNNTCQCVTPPGTQGLAGDVYLLKDITFPNVYTNNNIVAELTIENKDTTLTGPNPNATVNVIIRDSKGNMVGAFNPAQFGLTINGAVDVETILIQTSTAPFLNVGETYTLYATIKPFDDTSVANNDETIITNNSGFKTFTAINAPQAYSVPDSPWWMSALIVFSIIGFLFAQSKKETKN